MKTLIVYASKHGTVEECANKIQAKISNCTCCRIAKRKQWPKLDDYDTIILGASIHVGKIQATITEFCSENLSQLTQKRLGIFLCTMTPIEEAFHYIEEQFPKELQEHAVTKKCFGGAVRLERMNFVERFMMKKITKSDKNIYGVSDEAIEGFINDIMGR